VRKWHLVTYDVRDDARLRRVARLLEGYGDRLQYSVFRCRLGTVELERLRWELLRVVADEDELLCLSTRNGVCLTFGAGVPGDVILIEGALTRA
jgi:CRISPR-associated protein Cas2